jgi:hypothetical protein
MMRSGACDANAIPDAEGRRRLAMDAMMHRLHLWRLQNTPPCCSSWVRRSGHMAFSAGGQAERDSRVLAMVAKMDELGFVPAIRVIGRLPEVDPAMTSSRASITDYISASFRL